MRLAAILALALATALHAQTPVAPNPADFPQPIARVLDQQLTMVEQQVVPAAEAMPADKYNYQPTCANCDGVRTFALQVRHIANANTVFFSAILNRPTPPGVSPNGAANGPDDLTSKEAIVTFLKRSFALGHEAIATINDKNALTYFGASPFTTIKTRLGVATFGCSHMWDHYGQMVEYLRANNITPPASRGQPQANPAQPPANPTPKK